MTKPSQTRITKLLAVACALLVFGGSVPATAADAKRPNILFIIVDDQSPFDLRVYNSRSTLQTPNIDQLASQGMVFDAAYQMGSWTGGVCTASRHMIMSGRTLWHIPNKPGRTNNPHINNPTRRERQCVARRAGAGLPQRTRGSKRRRPVPDLLWVLAPTRYARWQAGVTGEIRCGESHRQERLAACKSKTTAAADQLPAGSSIRQHAHDRAG